MDILVPCIASALTATTVVIGEILKLFISNALIFKVNRSQSLSKQLPNTKKDVAETDARLSLNDIFTYTRY